MKKLFLIAVLILYSSVYLNSQTGFPLIKLNFEAVVNKKVAGLQKTYEKDQKIQFIALDSRSDGFNIIITDGSDFSDRVQPRNISNFDFIPPNNLKDFWLYQSFVTGTYSNFINNGIQYKLRNELEFDAIRFINSLYDKNLIFSDSYLEDYLYTIVHMIYPERIEDGRPGIINPLVMIDQNPNAFIFPNGTIILTTGLLGILSSVEELIAVMAHEIAHFVLDHSIMNINEMIRQQKRAEFWTTFATAIAGATEIYLALEKDLYFGGNLMYSTAILSTVISTHAIEQLGLRYSRAQENQADIITLQILERLGLNESALGSVLSKIKDYYVTTGDYFALTGEGTHPNIDSRIIRSNFQGEVFYNKEFIRKISLVNTLNAKYEYNGRKFLSCFNLVKSNIEANVATEDDYILMASSILKLFGDDVNTKEALNYLQKAVTLNVNPNPMVHKICGIAYLRLGNLVEAINSLNKYKSYLEQELKVITSINTPGFSSYYEFLNTELYWTRSMIFKIS